MPKVTAKVFALNFVSNFPLRLKACTEVASQRTAATLAASRALQSAPFADLVRNLYEVGSRSEISSNGNSNGNSSGNGSALAAVLTAACEAASGGESAESSSSNSDRSIDELFLSAQSTGSWPALVSTCKRLSTAVATFEEFMAKEERSAKVEGALPPLSSKVRFLD